MLVRTQTVTASLQMLLQKQGQPSVLYTTKYDVLVCWIYSSSSKVIAASVLVFKGS